MKSVLLLAMAVLASAAQDQISIIESAKRNGGKADLTIDVCGPAFSLAGSVSAAELVVRGIVLSSGPTLSRDQTMVVTELELAPLEFYKRTMAAADRPGVVSRLIVQRPGGHLNYEGLDLRTSTNTFPSRNPAMRVGDEIIVFVFIHPDDPGTYRVFSVLGVDSGFVAGLPPMKGLNAGAWTVDAFRKEISALIRP